MNDNWLKQTLKEPLFDNLLWSRPENKLHAGKVLVIGGNMHGFSKTVNSYQGLINAGIGQVTVLLPKSVKKILGHISSDVIYCPDTDTGSFGPESFADMLEYGNLNDGVFLPGELSNNSQTLVVIEKLVAQLNKPLIISEDSVELLLHYDETLINRENMTYVAGVDKLQKLLTKLKSPKPITSGMALVNLVEVLANFTTGKRLSIATIHQGYIVVAHEGRVATTKIELGVKTSIPELANHIVCWIIQNPKSVFEAINCAAISCQS